MMITKEEAISIQEQLGLQIVEEDELSSIVTIVAGVDVEYDKNSEFIAGSIVLLDATTKRVLEVATHVMQATFPYIPGLFSFREMPPLIEAYRKLLIQPDVIICDGQGRAHPRRFGLACHLGIELNLPTVGCAKTRLVGYYENLGVERGSQALLIDERTNETLGLALRTQTAINPLFVSVGHRVSLQTAAQLVLSMCDAVRLPETTRQADQYARIALEEFLSHGR